MYGTVELRKGDVIHVLVGQQGGAYTNGGGGGGGSFVAKGDILSSAIPLIVGGGGGDHQLKMLQEHMEQMQVQDQLEHHLMAHLLLLEVHQDEEVTLFLLDSILLERVVVLWRWSKCFIQFQYSCKLGYA